MAKTVTLRDTTTQEPLYPRTLPENVVDANGNSINAILNNTLSINDIPTLQSVPTNSTLTYTKDNQTINFKIGLLCRVEDLSLINGYSFYRLYDLIIENNNTNAIWQLVVDSGTAYSSGTAALLEEGTNTLDRLWSAKILYEYINYPNLIYDLGIQSTSGALTIDGSIPLHVITCTGNISSVSLSTNPSAGHSCHVIFTATAARTVSIAHNATTRVCPEAKAITLNITANGYVEVDFLNANDKIYVRGV